MYYIWRGVSTWKLWWWFRWSPIAGVSCLSADQLCGLGPVSQPHWILCRKRLGDRKASLMGYGNDRLTYRTGTTVLYTTSHKSLTVFIYLCECCGHMCVRVHRCAYARLLFILFLIQDPHQISSSLVQLDSLASKPQGPPVSPALRLQACWLIHGFWEPQLSPSGLYSNHFTCWPCPLPRRLIIFFVCCMCICVLHVYAYLHVREHMYMHAYVNMWGHV